MSFEDIPFKSNPNFKFKEKVTDKSDCLSATYQFDCFQNKNGDVILISPFFDVKNAIKRDYHISLINLRNNEVIKTLEAHKDRVLTVHYFQDNNKNDYFISADKKNKVIVWDLSNNCEKLFEFDFKYESFIYSCLLIFEGNKKYVVASSIGSNNITKVIDMADSNNVIDINESKDKNVYFLAHWINEDSEKNNRKHIIIQNCKNLILFSEFPSGVTYHKVEINQEYPFCQAGIVFKNQGKDYYAASFTYGLVLIIDLAKKEEVKRIIMNDVHLYSFVRWSDHYLLLNDCLQRRIIVMDMLDNYKIKSKIVIPEMDFEKFIKKVKHPKYGECLLSSGVDWSIKLLVNRSILNENI